MNVQPSSAFFRICVLTYNEEHLNDHVECSEGPFMSIFLEGSVVGNHESEVECTQDDEPIPDDFEDAIMQQDTSRGLELLNLVLGHGILCGEVWKLEHKYGLVHQRFHHAQFLTVNKT